MMLPNQTGRRDVEVTTPRAATGAGSGSDNLHYGISPSRTSNGNFMKALDELNERFGRDTLGFAGSGLARLWKLRRDLLSKRCTTGWNELREVSAQRCVLLPGRGNKPTGSLLGGDGHIFNIYGDHIGT